MYGVAAAEYNHFFAVKQLPEPRRQRKKCLITTGCTAYHQDMNVNKITGEQAFRAIESGEFGEDVIASCERVAVLMSQDWCPQWAAMRAWVFSIERDIDLYELVYNREPYFHEFRAFKEQMWRNGQIPYVRYYRGGKLTAESNYVSEEEFLGYLGL
jgi:hypothetical protein